MELARRHDCRPFYKNKCHYFRLVGDSTQDVRPPASKHGGVRPKQVWRQYVEEGLTEKIYPVFFLQ